MATGKKQVLIRMNPALYEKLKVVSAKNRRTVTNQVEYLIVQYLEDYEEKRGKIHIEQANVVTNNNNGNGNLVANNGEFIKCSGVKN